MYLFWLYWVFVAVCRLLSSCSEEGHSLTTVPGCHCGVFSCCGAWGLLLWRSTSSGHTGFSSGEGLVPPSQVDSSQTRGQAHVHCFGRQILNHWTTREVPVCHPWEHRVGSHTHLTLNPACVTEAVTSWLHSLTSLSFTSVFWATGIIIEPSRLSWEVKDNAFKALREHNIWHNIKFSTKVGYSYPWVTFDKRRRHCTRSKSAKGLEGDCSDVAEASRWSNLILNLYRSKLRLSFVLFFSPGR